jgi:hypothetical protein
MASLVIRARVEVYSKERKFGMRGVVVFFTTVIMFAKSPQ